MTSQPETTPGVPRKLEVRRAPKYVPFLIAGALAGVATAAIFTLLFPENGDFAVSSVFGLFAVLLVVPGMGLGAIAALVLDRRGRSKSKILVVESLPDDERNRGAEEA